MPKHLSRILLCTLLALPCLVRAQVINEVMTANFTTWVDEQGDPDDWIELYNPTADPIDISGWFLSDTDANLQKWQLPASEELVIPAEGFLVLFADNEPDEGPLHLGFSLKQTGDQVYLSNAEVLVDFIEFDFLWQDVSAGNTATLEWAVFDIPTPGMANNDVSYLGVLEPPQVFPPGGLTFAGEGEEDEVEVTLYHDLETAEIRYTLDGTTPNESSSLYAIPFEVEGNTTVKARAFHPLFLNSSTTAAPFLFELESTLDVISIACLEEDFSGSAGINSVNNGAEIPVDVTFFNDAGEIEHTQTMGMKRHAVDQNDQHGFRLLSRGVYGNSKLEMNLFDIRDHDTYDHLILRNSGNDAVENNGAGLRDGLLSMLYHDIDPDYGMSAHKPVSVYINGEYWGFYNLRERQDANWMEINYGYQCDDLDYLERTAGESDTRDEFCGSWDAFDALEEEAIDNDLTDPDAYAALVDRINIRNLYDYQAIEVYAVNQDWLSNNMKFWSTYEDPEWNWILWDVDWGLGTFYPAYPHGYPDWDALGFSLSNWGGWTSAVETELMQNLVENEEFYSGYATRAADLLNSTLRPDRVSERLLDMQATLAPEIPLYIERWSGNQSVWESEIEYMLTFIAERPGYMRESFSSYFDLGVQDTLHLDVSPVSTGYIEVNTIYTDVLPWEGVYFELLPVRLEAIPEFGFVFDHWEGLPEGADAESSEIFVDILDAPDVVAVFTPVDPGNELLPVINELLYKSSDLTQDWLELHNPHSAALDLSPWEICEDGDCLALEGLTLAPDSYLVIAQDIEAFQAHYGTEINAIGGLPFGLNSSGEQVVAIRPDLGLVDVVEYDNGNPWPEVLLEGTSIQLTNPDLDNAQGENWFAAVDVATPGAINSDEGASVQELTQEATLAVFPNPFSEVVALQFDAPTGGTASWRLVDLSGKEALRGSATIHAGANTVLLSPQNTPALADLPANLYVLEVTGTRFHARTRVVRR